jgi:hypothetical protein
MSFKNVIWNKNERLDVDKLQIMLDNDKYLTEKALTLPHGILYSASLSYNNIPSSSSPATIHTTTDVSPKGVSGNRFVRFCFRDTTFSGGDVGVPATIYLSVEFFLNSAWVQVCEFAYGRYNFEGIVKGPKEALVLLGPAQMNFRVRISRASASSGIDLDSTLFTIEDMGPEIPSS